MQKQKIGFLPLYLELYDKAMPERRAKVEEFYNCIVTEFEKRGLEVVRASVCRVKDEFASAVMAFEKGKVCAIVTLHLAYSPSLESAEILAGTELPIIVLDTTPDFEFSAKTEPDRIMYNHGIHGVMDMCNLLRRNGKQFMIETGHWQMSDVLDRVVKKIGSSPRSFYERDTLLADMVQKPEKIRVGLIGDQFKGMGDFAVDFDVLEKKFGINVVKVSAKDVASFMPDTEDPEVEAELLRDLERFDAKGLKAETHLQSVRAGLGVGKWIEDEGLSAFSMNFLSVDKASGLGVVPFLEASKAMTRGIGYAGEGDVLTAWFVGSLLRMFPETTFTEMFCPDWKNGSVFLSHMGEVNVDCIEGKARLVKKPFPWTDADDPVVAVGRLKPGKGVFADIAPLKDDRFSLILVSGEMMDVEGEDKMVDTVHGWFKPGIDLNEFLKQYSLAGGIHHSAFIYGSVLNELRSYGGLIGCEVIIVE